MRELLGFKVCSCGCIWEPFDDEQTALDVDIEGVVYGDSREACLAAIEAKYPCEDPRLSVVRPKWAQYANSGWSQDDRIVVEPDALPVYTRGDPWEALAIVKELGDLTCVGLRRRNPYGDDTPYPKWEEEGVISRGDGWYDSIAELRYNPKGILRAKRAAASRKKTQAVLCSEIGGCAWKLQEETGKTIPLPHHSGSYSKHYVCWLLLDAIKYFNFVYGNNAHRRHAAFKVLKADWKQRAKATRKSFYCNRDPHSNRRHGNHNYQTLLCNFMHAELQRRNSPTHEGAWMPIREIEDFEQYSYAKYGKKVKREEAKAEKAEAKAKEKAKKAKKVKKPTRKRVAVTAS